MKKLFLYAFALLSTFAVFSCSDKDDENSGGPDSNRLMRPTFRTNNTVAAGSNDPYLCKVVGLNSIQLYWSTVQGATGYQIKVSTNQSVAGSEENWNNPSYLELDTIIYGQNVDQLLLQDLKFSATYRFAIRALSPQGEAYHSQWWGFGDLRHWADMCYMTTQDRYNVPSIIYQKSNVTKDGFTVHLNRNYAKKGDGSSYSATDLEVFDEYFNTVTDQFGNKVWRVDYLVIEPAASNATAKVPDQFKKYKLSNDIFDADGLASVIVNGLDSNSVYNIYAYDETIAQTKAFVYAQYNLDMSARTKGDPGKPVIIEPNPQDTIHTMLNNVETPIDLPIAATPIQPLLEEFMSSNEYAENKTFYLRGGQNYYLTSGLKVYKGFKLATNPDDIAANGRAKVFLYTADVLRHQKPSPAFFMLGRTPEGSENPLITIDIDKFIIEDIDFSTPMVDNCGDGGLTNNYFMNMYSTGMGAVVEEITVKNCSFQNLVGGFYRVQANYGVRIKNFTVDNVDFYNGGYYSTAGRRYNWFHANPESNPKINIWENFVMKNCTIYDNPLGYMFNHNKQQDVEWPDDLHYNITLENNTFINFNTCNVGNSLIFNLRWIPGGSSFTLKRNLFVLTRQADDEARTMVQAGCDVRTINGSGKVTLDFEDNYSTNDNLTDGQIFSNTASAFNFTGKNTFGSFPDEDVTWGAAGRDGLTVKVADISATDLMVQPNPPHKLSADGVANHYDHMEDGIDGTITNVDYGIREGYVGGMVDLHFKNFNNVLVEKQIGAPKWRQQ